MKIDVMITDTIFRNEENGYSVLLTQHNQDEILVVGLFPIFHKGESVSFDGEYVDHPKYGVQFSAKDFTFKLPSSENAIETFLASGIIKGIGASLAKEIVKKFGKNTFNVFECTPYRLKEIHGIGDKKASIILDSYNEIVYIRAILMRLQNFGFTIKEALKISNFYGSNTLRILELNPYILIEDIEGIGFITADRIAQKLNFKSTDSLRVKAGILYYMQYISLQYGHTIYPNKDFIIEVGKLLNIDEAFIYEELENLFLSGKLKKINNNNVFYICSAQYFEMEKYIAYKLTQLMKASFSDINNLEIQPNLITQLDNTQKQAVYAALQNNISIITGGPGTGKTTVIRSILECLKAGTYTLCAPTGRAAKRMTQATGCEAATIHKLLEFGQEDNVFQKDEDNTLDFNTIIIDEMSMVDIHIFYHLCKAVTRGTRLIFVGDVDQLPSVGAGNVLKDLIDSNAFPVTFLTEIYRQQENSLIIDNARKVNNGVLPTINNNSNDFYVLFQNGREKTRQLLPDLFLNRLPKYLKLEKSDIIKNIQILAPMKKGICGTIELNEQIQNMYIQRKNKFVEYANKKFYIGDKVLQTKNDYSIEYRDLQSNTYHTGLFNGEIGEIINIEDDLASIIFDETKLVRFSRNDFENIDLAYCLTVHKSQGSEFPVVVLVLSNGPSSLLTKNLLYTAITRASKMIVLIGDQYALEKMVNNTYVQQRFTNLKYLLQNFN